jgi:hypothetical protein
MTAATYARPVSTRIELGRGQTSAATLDTQQMPPCARSVNQANIKAQWVHQTAQRAPMHTKRLTLGLRLPMSASFSVRRENTLSIAHTASNVR